MTAPYSAEQMGAMRADRFLQQMAIVHGALSYRTFMRPTNATEAVAAQRFLIYSADPFRPHWIDWRFWWWRENMLKRTLEMSADARAMGGIPRAAGFHLFCPGAVQIGPNGEVLLALLLGENGRVAGFFDLDPPGEKRFFHPKVVDLGEGPVGKSIVDQSLHLAVCMAALLESEVTARAVTRASALGAGPGRPRDRAEVTTVLWRRAARGDGAPTGKRLGLDKHWWVTGHFRTLDHDKPPSQRRQVYVRPHKKGNPDAPLYDPRRVNLVAR